MSLFRDPLTVALAETAKNIMENKVMCEACGKMHAEGKCSMAEGKMSELDMAGDELISYAKKHGGMDKKDFMKAADLIKKGDLAKLVKFTNDLDTDPRDFIIMKVADAVGAKQAGKMFKVDIRASKKYEDVELPEEITDEDAGDFVVAAAAAKKAGKKKFKFGDKEYPVTIKTDIKTEEFVAEKMDPTDHVKKKGDKFCVYNADGSIAKEFDNKDDADKYAIDNHEKLMATAEARQMKDPKKDSMVTKKGKTIVIDKSKEKEYLKKGWTLAEEDLDEALKTTHVVIDTADDNKVVAMASSEKGAKSSIVSAERPPMSIKDKKTLKVVKLKKPAGQKAADKLIGYPLKEEDLQEYGYVKSAKSDYDIKHKTFSSAIQHAVEIAMKKGYEVDADDYDQKVAMGPKKPSKGKTNSYSIKLTKNGKEQRKALQVQIANLDNKFFELNMYIQ